jgi:hypothetical protein
VDRTFNQSLPKQNIKAGFKTTWIWPLNLKVMDNRSEPSKLYTIESNLNISNDEDGQSEGVIDGSQWGENKIIVDLINIVTTL